MYENESFVNKPNISWMLTELQIEFGVFNLWTKRPKSLAFTFQGFLEKLLIWEFCTKILLEFNVNLQIYFFHFAKYFYRNHKLKNTANVVFYKISSLLKYIPILLHVFLDLCILMKTENLLMNFMKKWFQERKEGREEWGG